MALPSDSHVDESPTTGHVGKRFRWRLGSPLGSRAHFIDAQARPLAPNTAVKAMLLCVELGQGRWRTITDHYCPEPEMRPQNRAFATKRYSLTHLRRMYVRLAGPRPTVLVPHLLHLHRDGTQQITMPNSDDRRKRMARSFGVLNPIQGRKKKDFPPVRIREIGPGGVGTFAVWRYHDFRGPYD
jgi:hypothetical protein